METWQLQDVTLLHFCNSRLCTFFPLFLFPPVDGGKINLGHSPTEWPVAKRSRPLCHIIFSKFIYIYSTDRNHEEVHKESRKIEILLRRQKKELQMRDVPA